MARLVDLLSSWLEKVILVELLDLLELDWVDQTLYVTKILRPKSLNSTTVWDKNNNEVKEALDECAEVLNDRS